MKNHKKRLRVHSPWLDNILSLTAIVSLIILTFAAVGGVLWMLLRTGILSGELWQFDPPTNETAVVIRDNGVFDALRPTSQNTDTAPDDTSGVVRFSGSFSTLRTLLSDIDAPDSYNALFETVIHAKTGNSECAVRVYRSGDAYRINRYIGTLSAAGKPTEYYICDGTSVLYADNRTQTEARFPISTTFSVEALAGIPSIASFNAIPDDRILHASYAELNGEIVYYVLYTTPTIHESHIIHEVWISASTELVQRCNTYLCPVGTDPFSIIGKEDRMLFSSALISTAALSRHDQQTLFILPKSEP